MSGKTVSLCGEVPIRSGSVYTTVDALEALKCVGMAYGLYDHSEELDGSRVVLDEAGERPALVVQQDIGLHGSPFWQTVRTITDDPKQIRRYMDFRKTVGMIREVDRELERQPEKRTNRKGGQRHER